MRAPADRRSPVPSLEAAASVSRQLVAVEVESPVEEAIHLVDAGIARVLTLILYVGFVERRACTGTSLRYY